MTVMNVGIALMMRSRPMNKYDYLWVVQGYYACGWEDLTAGSWREARIDLKAYRANEKGIFRVIQRRVLK